MVKHMNLHDLDLNLLVLFEAIYKEGGLTLAGKKLGLTQSAMSHALSRLRQEFNDQHRNHRQRYGRATSFRFE